MPCNKANLGFQTNILGHVFKKKVGKAKFILGKPFYYCFKVDEINEKCILITKIFQKYHFCYFHKLVGYISFSILIVT